MIDVNNLEVNFLIISEHRLNDRDAREPGDTVHLQRDRMYRAACPELIIPVHFRPSRSSSGPEPFTSFPSLRSGHAG